MKSKVLNMVGICVLFTLLLLPIFYSLCVAVDLEYSILKKVAYLWVVLLLLLLPALFLKSRAYFLIQGIFNFLFFPIDIASLYLNKQSTSSAFLQNILRTDIGEATELLVSLWPLCIVVGVLYVLYFVLAFKVENQYLVPKKLRKVILISAVLAVVTGVTVFTIYGKTRHKNRSILNEMSNAVQFCYIKLYKIYPYNLYLGLADIVSKQNYQKKLEEQVSTFSFGIKPQANGDNPLYILVIGEAARYDHLSLNGYERNTTPLLQARKNLISYDSAYAQANLTSYSLPLIITRATADGADRAYREKSIVEAFQEAGYYSGYLNKQLSYAIETRIVKVSDYAYQSNKEVDVENNYDIDLVAKLQECVSDTSQFFVLHTMGSHFRYEYRYPAEFEQFTPVMGKSFSYLGISEENKSEFINAYDNTILYLDYFLNELIEYVDGLNRSAIVVYISDHGESFWDDDKKLSLHGSYEISKYEFHVPMLVWYSDEYQLNNSQKVENIKQNKAKTISSDAIFYSMLDIAGIKEVTDSTKSICSEYLQPIDSVWVFNGQGKTKQVSLKNF